jgi:hypothetical protein
MLLAHDVDTSTGTSSNAVFHHPRSPHTFQLYFAWFATVVYAVAVPGLLSVHNPLAAGGWGAACGICLAWALLLGQENRWRRLENLEVSNPQDGCQSNTDRQQQAAGRKQQAAGSSKQIGAATAAALAKPGLHCKPDG